MEVLADRRRLLRVACAKSLPADQIEAIASAVAEAVKWANELRPNTEMGYPDRDGDWITKRSEQ